MESTRLCSTRFNQAAPVDTCQALQYAATAAGAGNAEFTAFYNCFQKNAGLGGSLSAQGQWTTVFLRQDTGAAITGGVGYVWGYSSRLLPSGQVAYLVEFPQAGARFNLSQEPPRQLAVNTVGQRASMCSRASSLAQRGREFSPRNPSARTAQAAATSCRRWRCTIVTETGCLRCSWKTARGLAGAP